MNKSAEISNINGEAEGRSGESGSSDLGWIPQIDGVHFPSLLGEFQAFLCTFWAFYHTLEITSLGGRAEGGESAAGAQHPKMQTYGMGEI